MICTRYLLSTLAMVSLLIAGCGGGGGGGSKSETVPSLGMIRHATVTFYRANDPACPDNCPVVGTANTGTSGVITPNISGYNGPLVIEISGNASAQYFDEALMEFVDFPAGQKLRAITPTTQGRYGVTVLTELAYQQALREGSFPLDAASVNRINTNIKDALAPGLNSILATPTLFASTPGPNSLQNNQGSLYAVYLAGFAKLGAGQASPALAVLNALVEDIKDGALDGKKNGIDLTPAAPYGDLAAELKTAMQDFVGSYGNTSLQGKVDSIPDPNPVVFTPPVPGIALTQPASSAIIAQSNADGQVDLELTVATTHFDLADGGWRLHINGTAEPGSFTAASVVHATELAPGNHVLTVELLDDEHRPFEPPVFSAAVAIQVTVFETDTVPPVLTVPVATTLDAPVGETSLPASTTEIAAFLAGATAVDAVDGNLTAGITHDAPVDFPIGTTTVTFTVTDAAGNIATDTSTVTVNATVVTPTYSISGTITGATGNLTWELQDQGGAIWHDGPNAGNGDVTFSPGAGLEAGFQYQILVTYPPAGQTCDVINGTGTLAANVSNVQIQCEDIPAVTWSISGTISGAGSNVGWVLAVDGTTAASGSDGNGAVTFTSAAASDSSYVVSISSDPAGQTCTVTNGSGTLTANVGNVQISCTDDEPAEPVESLLPDFSGLNLKPEVPAIVPVAPVTAAIDPSDKIATLYAGLAAAESARIFAVPDNLTVTVGNIASGTYQVTERTADLTWSRVLTFDFGADGIPNTEDDFLRAWSVGFAQATGSLTYNFVHPGPDGVWFTEDDVAGSESLGGAISVWGSYQLEFESPAQGAVLILPCVEVGSDQAIFTEDDRPCSLGGQRRYQVAVLDGDNQRGQLVTYNGAGPDGKWFTADDQVERYELATFNSEGISEATVSYNARGTDNQWFTEDDVVQNHTVTLLGDDYKPRYTATYNAVGEDGDWFTEDDVILAWTYYGYDASGNPVLVANHTDIGGDGQWFTADDTASAAVTVYDDNGNVQISYTLSGAGATGPDAIWLTADDNLNSVTGYSYSLYDNSGRRTHHAADIRGKGADDQWFTTDDRPHTSGIYQSYEYDSEGQIILTVTYSPAQAIANPSEPLFSAANVQSYIARQYSPEGTLVRQVNVSDFGDDGLPFTEDDRINWPYRLATADGYDLFDSPGPDGIWFTEDDARVGPNAGYVVTVFDGKRRISHHEYTGPDAAGADGLWRTGDDVATRYSLAEDIEPDGTHKWRSYARNGDGAYVPSASYALRREDAAGNVAWNIEHNADDVPTSIIWREYDSHGNVTLEASASNPGKDGIWETEDDFLYKSLRYYDNAGQPLYSAGARPGPDGIWGTADDTLTIETINRLQYEVATLAQNAGFVAASCDAEPSTSGDIKVQVRDQSNDLLAGVIVQLGEDGTTTATTDVSGWAEFSGLTGTRDVHLFKDGYTWESFYCVAPGEDVVLVGKLNSLTEKPRASAVWFTIAQLTNLASGSRIELVLVDDNGQVIGNGVDPFDGNTTRVMRFEGLPQGSTVSGDLWVLEHGWNSETGKLHDAVLLEEQVSYTTVSDNYNDYPEKENLTIAFPSSSKPESTVILAGSSIRQPSGFISSTLRVTDIDNLLRGTTTLPIVDLPTPLTPVAAIATGSGTNGNAFTEWRAYLPLSGPLPVAPQIHSGFQYPAYVTSQQIVGSNPVITWKAAQQKEDDYFATLNTLELRRSFPVVGWLSAWTIHTPAGQQSITLPTLPAGINSGLLPESQYGIRLHTRAVPSLSYQELLAEDDVHTLDTRHGLANEVLTVGGSFNNDALLTR